MSIRLNRNLTVKIATVVIQEENVLLIQENSLNHMKKWYLPSGHLENHETLLEGAKRETLEESGIEVEIMGLICIEIQSNKWMRIVFQGCAISGNLKTKSNKESIKAQWIPLEELDALSLRSNDIKKLIHHCAVIKKPPIAILPRTDIFCCSIKLVLYLTIENPRRILVDESHKVPILDIFKYPTHYKQIKKIIKKVFPDIEITDLTILSYRLFRVDYSGCKSNPHEAGFKLFVVVDLNQFREAIQNPIKDFSWSSNPNLCFDLPEMLSYLPILSKRNENEFIYD